MHTIRVRQLVVAALTVVTLSACASQKEPAQAAMTATTAAFKTMQPDAQNLVPDQATTIQAALTTAQGAFDKGDYAAVLQQTSAINAQIVTLGTAVAAKKAAGGTEWAALKMMVPSMITALDNRVQELLKAKTLPTGVTKEMVKAAQDGVGTATIDWSKAMIDGASGNPTAAVERAKQIMASMSTLVAPLK